MPAHSSNSLPSAEADYFQDSVLQAFVVDVTDTAASFVVTHVLEGHEEYFADEHFIPEEFRTIVRSPCFMQLPSSFRALTAIAAMRPRPLTSFNHLDLRKSIVHTPIEPGDTVHIHNNYYQNLKRSSLGRIAYEPVQEVCKLPIHKQEVQKGLLNLQKKRIKLAKLLARTVQRHEQLDMQSKNRVVPNQPFLPFEQSGTFKTSLIRGDEYFKSRNVFGAAQVKDHFLDVTARPLLDIDEDLGGVQRFGANGQRYVVRHITPFGQGSPDNPLYSFEIHMHSETVQNPAMGEQQAYVILDGKKYLARKDVEGSSVYFENPGHDLRFSGFDEEGSTLNTLSVTPEQEEALRRMHALEQKITMSTLYGAIDNGRDFIAEDEAIGTEAAARIKKAKEQLQGDVDLIESIKDNPLSANISTGAMILVPKSMLDSITIVFETLK